MDSLKVAQSDMSSTYRNGAVGVLVSGLVWLTAALVSYGFSPRQAIWALLVGGALIHPISTLVIQLLGGTTSTHKDNPLVRLAMEGTLFMLMSIPLAYGLASLHPSWFFQGMLLIIGGRYLTFQTLYGNKLYWLFGAVLGVSGYGLYITNTQPMVTLLTGGIIEVGFSVLLFYDFLTKKKARAASLSSLDTFIPKLP
ncbi:hypothetical protein [Spirosoma sp.]|uniref:DUF7010 family protein n=1 Tax=Spirosoma sp. TaxID=1899569 RepID=UPI002601CF16|nr:hypothetical protein [Spirosoma sp.]MCX6212832.1 hypothetical protein [Spirosoma sp.]